MFSEDGLWLALCFSSFFFAVRFFFHGSIFQRVALWMSTKGDGDVKTGETGQSKIEKCSDSLWKLTYCVAVEACVLSITYHDSWFWNTKEFFKGWPNQPMPASLKLYYMCQCGYYMYSSFALLLWETRRKDFGVMMSHHVISFILIEFSYTARLFRIGAVTLALHDASDALLEAAKVLKYSDHDLGASIVFALFAVSWAIGRLIVYPLWIVSSFSLEFRHHTNLSEAYPKFLYYSFSTMMLILLVFHVYWWILICKMMAKQLNNKGKVGEDIRSDSEDDE